MSDMLQSIVTNTLNHGFKLSLRKGVRQAKAYRTLSREFSFLRGRLFFQTLRRAVVRQSRSQPDCAIMRNPRPTTLTTHQFVSRNYFFAHGRGSHRHRSIQRVGNFLNY